jgi:hypothetical protein
MPSPISVSLGATHAPNAAKISNSEVAEFFTAHFAHRVTALLCVAKRSEQSDFWQGRGDLFCASIEGSFIMFRMFVEFLGLESYRLDSGEHDLRRRSLKKRRPTDVMLDNFGLPLAEPTDFDPHRALIGRVHDGVSKATAHLTYEANDFFDSARDYIPALNELVRVIYERLYKPFGRDFDLHPDLKRLYESA